PAHEHTDPPPRPGSTAGCTAQPKLAGCGKAAAPPRAQDSSPASPVGVRWVSGVTALRCHGVRMLWVSSGAVLPPPPLVSWRPFWPWAGALAYSDAAPLSLSLTPPDPPPRWTGV